MNNVDLRCCFLLLATTLDTNDLTVALTAGILGVVGVGTLIVLIFLCVLLMVYKCPCQKRDIHTAIAASNAQCKFESPYDYIDSTDVPFSNHVQDASNMAYYDYIDSTDVHLNTVIMTQSNEAYGVTCTNLNNETAIYESIGPAESDKSKDEFETEANCTYGAHSDMMVVSPNHAYGVHVRSKEEDVHY